LGTARLYVDGVKQTDGSIAGNFSRWNATARLALANTIRGDQPWLGAYQMIAYYNRALSPAEVDRRYQAGPAAVPTR
jgi:hypothetical protein